MDITEKNEKYTLEISKDEALVLFHWVSEYNDNKNPKKENNDKAENIILWQIENCLETLLVEPLKDNYNVLLENSRKKIRDTIEE